MVLMGTGMGAAHLGDYAGARARFVSERYALANASFPRRMTVPTRPSASASSAGGRRASARRTMASSSMKKAFWTSHRSNPASKRCLAICSECHTADLSGQLLLNAPFAVVYSANLTPGKGGAGSEFTDADWVRALRHGVDNQGRALVVMPAQLFWNFNDKDLGEIIAYLKSLPPVDKQHPDPQITAMGKIMAGAGSHTRGPRR